MQGTKKPPTSEVVETSKAPYRSERSTRPPSPMSTRRDDRAEPDDDEVTSSRIDVVNVGGGGASGDSAASAMVTLRRELAKLHQQAAAVEKSLEDQRRDRSDALDRSERATERALQLEARVAGLEAEALGLRKMHEATTRELQTVRAERDDLELAVDAAKTATAEVGRLKEEIERLRAGADDSARASAELAKAKTEIEKARKAAEIAEQDALLVGEQATRVREEAAKLRADADAMRAELTTAREETKKAREDAETARTDATRALEEAKNAREDANTARADVAKALEDAITGHEEATKLREELGKARNDATRIGDDLSKLRAELARAKEDNTRDRATARDRIDLMESALDDARAATSRLELELEVARTNEERLGRELEAALHNAAQAEQRATTTAMSHAALEHSVRRLREEIAGAFARVGHGAPPPPLPNKQIVSIPPEMVQSLPPDAMSIPPAPAALNLDPATGASTSPAEEGSDANVSSSPASKSVPPPAAASLIPPQGSIPPPMYASVPPQVHASAPPPSPSGSVPPGGRKTAPPPPTHASIRAAAVGSNPPPARTSERPDSIPPDHAWNDSSPPTRRPGLSAVPPPMNADLDSKQRQELLVQLVDPDHAQEAAVALRQRPEWLRSVPPPTLVAALSSVDYDAEGAVFELARAWDREPLCHALIASLRSESDVRLREHSAWLLKHLAAPSSWKAIADLAKSEDEPAQLRRWLLEALDRLAAGRAIGWRELGDLVTTLAHDPDASLRDGVVGILVSLDRSEEKRRLLLEILRDDTDEVVLASAVNALASVLPMDLDQELMNRLLGHSSPRVQRSVRDLVERVKQTKQ